ncbi:MAG: hypothetical protein RMJ82_01005 [Gemmatales bacterium]|nr:hypothetical protein [Gemmatales bacterium]
MNPESSVLTLPHLLRENAAHDRWIFGLMVVTLAVVAAYPVGVGNPEAQLYLSAGRLLVHGEFPYGSDPFAFAPHSPQGWPSWQRFLGMLGLGPKQLDWVNTGWLAEIIFYLAWRTGGGAGLVLGRVITLMIIIGLLAHTAQRLSQGSTKVWSRTRGIREDQSGLERAYRPYVSWLSVGLLITGLVLSVRLNVRPESFGLVYLACLFALLTEPAHGATFPTAAQTGFRRWWHRLLQAGRGRLWWLIPGLFLLWANCDSSVLIGLAVLLLYWVGQHMQAMWGPERYGSDVLPYEERRLLGQVILVSALAVCCNPFHLHVFDPSPLLFSETAALLQKSSPQAARLGLSPFSTAFFAEPGGAYPSLAECGYFVILGLTLAGLWFGRASWRWPWFLPALLGLLLSAYLAKYTAWFAVLALPGLWKHWHGYLTTRFGGIPQTTRRALLWTQSGRLALVAVLLALLIATLWPQPGSGTALGWVTRRGWGFSLMQDASLAEAARVARDWQAAGSLPGKALHLDWVQAAPYWASLHTHSVWLDVRAGLYTRQAVQDFLEVVQALEKTGTVEGQQERRRWQMLLRQYDVSHIVVHSDTTVSRLDAGRRRVQVALLPLLLADRDEQGQPTWELLDYLDGATFLLAWTGSPHWPKLQHLRFIPERRWRVTEPEDVSAVRDPVAFGGSISRVGRDLEPWRTLRIYFTGQPEQPALATLAARWLFVTLHDWRQRLASPRLQATGLLVATRLASGTATLPCNGLSGTLMQAATLVEEGWPNLPRVPRFVYQTDAVLWLSWRWARQGILQSPHHPFSWGVCYDIGNFLDTHEAQFLQGLRPETRLLARMFILRELTRLQPEMANAQLELARRYVERGCEDLALAHAEQFLQLPQGSPADTPAPQQRLEEYLGMSLEQLRQRVAEARGRFEPTLRLLTQPAALQGRPGEVLARAREMWQARLAGTALHLLQSLMRSLSPRQPEFAETVLLLADIYLQTGDAVSLHRLLDQPWSEAVFGPERITVWRALTAGALGEPLVEAELRQAVEQRLQRAAAQAFLQGATQLALGGDLGPAGSFFNGLYLQQQALTRSRERLFNLLAQACAELEAGQIARARNAFEQIPSLAPTEPLASLAEHYLRILPSD